MLVNIIYFRPRVPMLVTLLAVTNLSVAGPTTHVAVTKQLTQIRVVNASQIPGAEAIVVSKHYLGPTVVQNASQIGTQEINITLRRFHQTRVVNTSVLGSNRVRSTGIFPVAVHNTSQFGGHAIVVTRRYLHQTRVVNASVFGADVERISKRYMAPSTVHNTSTFGSTTVGFAAKKYSYTNTLGSGDRTASITVTSSGGSVSGTLNHIVNGNLTENDFFFSGAVTLKFDLGTAKIVKQARFRQSNTTAHTGLFQWSGSNDDSSYTNIGGTFGVGGSLVSIQHTLIDNAIAYRYYKLTPTTGSYSSSPWIIEMEFFIEGATQDEGDTSYAFPAGGGSATGNGSQPPLGGTGVDRNSLITPTSSLTGSGGTLSNLVDGNSGNNSSDSWGMPSGATNEVLKFQFATKHRITGFIWEQQDSTSDQGLYTLAGSNDDSSYTTIATGLDLVVGTSFTENLFTNTVAYTYYRLTQTSGTTNSAPWIHEVYFKCCPTIY